MIQRLTALFILLFTLTGASVAPSDYCIVDDNPLAVRGQYTTVQGAIDYGCSYIEVRKGEYPEFVLNRPNVTIEMQGARIHNDGIGNSVSVQGNATGATIKGDWTIWGNSDGTVLGGFYDGTGVYVTPSRVTLEGLKCVNLIAFCVLAPDPTADYLIVENFDIQNVATVRDKHKCAGTAIQLIADIEYATIRNGRVTGYSQAIGLWYGVSNSVVSGNTLVDNYGWIGTNCDGSRSAIEDYNPDEEGNTGNIYRDNYIDGSNGAGFELADVLFNTVVRGNVVRNAYGGGFGVAGSANNRGTNITIESNTFYGVGNGHIDATNWFSGSGSIRDNLFIGWQQDNVGTILIPSDRLGEPVTIIGNTFNGNGRIARLSGGNVEFSHNVIVNPTYSNALYIDNGVSDIWIKDNRFESDGGSQAVNSNGASRLTITNNYIQGHLSLLGGTSDSLIIGNEIHSTAWLALSVPHASRVMGNDIFTDGIPLFVDNGITGAMIADNFVARLNGSAAVLPNCGANTCRDNWTVP